ncbi:cytidylyltransferase [Sarocladium implicatum]|nr:cytidylyltransferase [Sarocladium implicatum]
MSELQYKADMSSIHRTLVEHLSRSLTAFQSSADRFRVLYTLPWTSDASGASNLSGAHAKATTVGKRIEKLVVMDSSFNPPTRAHFAMLQSALSAVRVSKQSEGDAIRVLLLLAVKNADKAAQPAAFPLRLGMMAAFGQEIRNAENGPDLHVDVGVTTEPYFHDKALAIQHSEFYGTGSATPLQVFLAGFDTLIRVFNPKYYEGADGGMKAALGPFFESSRLRVTLRGDDDWGSTEEQRQWVKDLAAGGLEAKGGRKEWLDKIELVDGVEGGVVSSSRVREAVKLGKRVDGMVGREVMSWIEEQGLYRDG